MSITSASRATAQDRIYQEKRARKCKLLHMNVDVMKENSVESLLFEDHVFEHVMHLQGEKPFQSGNKIFFPFQQTEHLNDAEISDDAELQTYFEKIQAKKCQLWVKTEGKAHFRIDADTIDFETFKTYLHANYNEEMGFEELDLSYISVIYPTEYLDTAGLVAKRVIHFVQGSGYRINKDEYCYLKSGFRSYKRSNITTLEPYKHIENHDGNYYLDVVVRSTSAPSLLNALTQHASFRLTSSLGEVYSVGIANPGENDIEIHSPDFLEFYPQTSCQEYVKRYQINGEKEFEILVAHIQIKMLQWSYPLPTNPQAYYHKIRQNCAHFCENVISYAKETELITPTEDTAPITKQFFDNLQILLVAIFESIYLFFNPVNFDGYDERVKTVVESQPILLPQSLLL